MIQHADRHKPATVLLSGVDTLHLSTHNMLCGEVLTHLEEVCQQARRNHEPAVTSMNGVPWLVHPTAGKGGFQYRISNDDLTIIARAAPCHLETMPNVIIELSSAFLNCMDWTRAYERTIDYIADLIDGSGEWAEGMELPAWAVGIRPEAFKIARADLHMDLQGWQMDEEDAMCMCLPGLVRRALYWVARGFTGGEWVSRPMGGLDPNASGYAMGKGPIVLRCYDKTREIRNSGKRWFVDLWEQTEGYQHGETVTRVEFQMRRSFLKQFHHGQAEGVSSVEDLAACYGSLWRYLCGDPSVTGRGWATLRVADRRYSVRELARKRKDRWAIHPVWEQIRDYHVGDVPLRRVQTRQIRDADRLAPPYLGYRSTIEALLALSGEGMSGRLRDVADALVGPYQVEQRVPDKVVRVLEAAARDAGVDLETMDTRELLERLVGTLLSNGLLDRQALDRRVQELVIPFKPVDRLRRKGARRGRVAPEAPVFQGPGADR